MSLAALLYFGGDEIILVSALIIILSGAKRFPQICEGLRQAIKEFMKALHEVRQEMSGQEPDEGIPSHPVLMAVTFALGVTCLVLVIYEFSK